jgi:hypothetical protein
MGFQILPNRHSRDSSAMKLKTLFSSASSSIMMIGAGFCAALLYAVLRQGTFQAVILGHVTPLPIMISTLGLGPFAGFISAIVATLTVVGLSSLEGGISPTVVAISCLVTGGIFLVAVALPAWWLSFLASLSRTQGSERWRSPYGERTLGPLEFYPIGHILVHVAAIIIALAAIALATMAFHIGNLGADLGELTEKLQPFVARIMESRPEFKDLDLHRLSQFLLQTFLAVWAPLVLILNLWLAGRILLISNRLPRPWPLIAHELRIPGLLVIAFAASLGLCAIKGWVGEFGEISAATLCVIYALQGIAVAHDLSGWTRWRGLLLVVIYTVVILFTPWSLVLFALLALADTVFAFRDRKPVLVSSKS